MERLYFIRVGGTAMGAVAGALASRGYEVHGSEEVLYEPMKSFLAGAGVQVHSQFDSQRLEEFNPAAVVVGNAVSRGNVELEAALNARLPLVSLPELIASTMIQRRESVVIAGTHGKTTTTAMTVWMLESGGLNPGFLIGGVPGNFDVGCRFGEGDVIVVEGDEYDSAYWDKRSKFMHYRPTIGVINNIEFDHGDIFEGLPDVMKAFRLFSRLPPQNGLLLANGDDANVRELLKSPVCPVETFGLGETNDWRITESDADGFTLFNGKTKLGRVETEAVGEANHRNLTVAAVVGLRKGMTFEQVQQAAREYRHPKRRMEEIGHWRGALVIDDFGHHPTAIRETLAAIRTKYPGRRILAAFEPRTNTTTRNVFQDELAACFEGATVVALGALDRVERYAVEERLDTGRLVSELESRGISAYALPQEFAADKDWGRHLRDWLAGLVREGDVLVVFSNGDMGGLRGMLVG